MIRVALKGLAGRKFRVALTAIAIVLGVAMISGTYILTDTIDKAFGAIFEDTYAGTDAIVTGQGADISFEGDTSALPPVEASLLPQVRQLPEAEAAAGSVVEESAAKIIGDDGKAIDTQGAPAFGFGIDFAQPRFNPIKLLGGRWPRNGNEVVIDTGVADDEGFRIGDTVRVASLQPVRPFELVGIAQYGTVSSLGAITFAVFTIPEAQRLFERERKYDAISAAAKSGITQDELVQSILPILPPDTKVQSAEAQAQEDSDDVSEFTSFIRYFLLAFAGISLFVGAFVIFNTLSITVAQRAREFATVRTIGASRRQILGIVVLEALVIGVSPRSSASSSGSRSRRASTASSGAQPRPPDHRPRLRHPDGDRADARRRDRDPSRRPRAGDPRHACTADRGCPRRRRAAARETLPVHRSSRDHDRGRRPPARLRPVRRRPRHRRAAALDCGRLLVAVHRCRAALAAARPPARVAARLAGLPDRRRRRPARPRNARRNPGRTAATAAALMIGIALVTFVAVLAAGHARLEPGRDRAAGARRLRRHLAGRVLAVRRLGRSRRRDAPGVTVSSDVRSELGKAADSSQYITGIDPATITDVYPFDWEHGSAGSSASSASNGAIVADDFADEENLEFGDRFQPSPPTGRGDFASRRSTSRRRSTRCSAPTLEHERFDQLFERPRNQFIFVNVAGGPSDEAGTGSSTLWRLSRTRSC